MKNKRVLLSLFALLTLASCGNNTPEETSSSSAPVIEDRDVVSETKINLTDEAYNKVFTNKSARAYDTSIADFQRDGVERMLTDYDYAPNNKGDVFTNYVDGDTTQFTSYNGNYTVKVRYLGVDTPESTSEIEEWGKSASNFNKSILKKAKHVIVQSAQSARTGDIGKADLDVYGRSLAYVWYSNDESATPAKDSFRNLNLELVYNGFSIFSGRKSDMEATNLEEEQQDYFYNSFMEANDIARHFKKNMYSGLQDPNYWYDDPLSLGLDQIYDEKYYVTHKDEIGHADGTYSSYCDDRTRWEFEGVISRVVGSSFYIQDEIKGRTYGLYVFSNNYYYPIVVGNRIKVSGILSFYGGAYELIGIHYNDFVHAKGDIELISENNPVTPIDVTAQELASGKYNAVLVRLHNGDKGDNHLYFNTTNNTFNGETTSYSYGGSEEVNAYNTTYPFYNTDNSMVVYGKFGSDMDANPSFNTMIQGTDYVRIKIDRSISITDPQTNDVITSYKYFTGEKSIYVQGNAAQAKKYLDGSEALPSGTNEKLIEQGIFVHDFKRKKVNDPIGIAINYVSSGGNQKYSLNICSDEDFHAIEEVA